MMAEFSFLSESTTNISQNKSKTATIYSFQSSGLRIEFSSPSCVHRQTSGRDGNAVVMKKGNPVHAHSKAHHILERSNVSVYTLVCMFECKWVWEYASVILKENIIFLFPSIVVSFSAHRILSMNIRNRKIGYRKQKFRIQRYIWENPVHATDYVLCGCVCEDVWISLSL